jgi:hypothetical protein
MCLVWGVVLSIGSGPLEGCYEARWERLAGSIVGGTGFPSNPYAGIFEAAAQLAAH